MEIRNINNSIVEIIMLQINSDPNVTDNNTYFILCSISAHLVQSVIGFQILRLYFCEWKLYDIYLCLLKQYVLLEM
ncbi:hypothetical protein C0J52_18187 [Blattella germanica]|nr:hypothetical protein C0J52_18187 [Blattella germanica]